MPTFSSESKQGQSRQASSRRYFFKWVSQTAIGVSVAAVGLGIVDPRKAFANCIICDDQYQVTTCRGRNTSICPPNSYYIEVWEYELGCLRNGCCPHTVFATACSPSCPNPIRC